MPESGPHPNQAPRNGDERGLSATLRLHKRADFYVRQLGWAVGTLREGDRKAPVGGQNAVTDDPALLATTSENHPARGCFANLQQSGLIEIECDIRGNRDGRLALAQLEAQLTELPQAWLDFCQRQDKRQNGERFQLDAEKIPVGRRRRELLRYAGQLVASGVAGDLLDYQCSPRQRAAHGRR
jgi:Bifunctional DNA primase/polymerase, N-terminal